MIAAYAIRCHTVFVYCRGEFLWPGTVVQRAIAELYAAGYAGKGILGSDYDLDIVLHRGAGAYICGEETALLSSLEGFRGQPRLRPPFPAVEGLYESPTVINNVETLCNVPHIVKRGADWFKSQGTEKAPGTKMFTISGQGRAARQLRAAARHAVPRAARGVRRRHARRRHAEGMDAGRVVDADAHRRAPRRRPGLRVDRGGGLAARAPARAWSWTRPTASSRPRAGCSSSTRTSPAASARRAARARGGPSACSAGSRTGYGRAGGHAAAVRGRREHPVPGVLRAGRRRGVADLVDAAVLHGRVRGARASWAGAR